MALKAIVVIFSFALAGCVQITSDPPGADLFLRGERVGKTPFDTGLEPEVFYDGSGKVRVEMPGYVIDSVRID